MHKNIKDNDWLGRAVFSRSRSERAARKGHIAHDIFLEKPGRSLSVDRFGFCSEEKLTGIQDQNAKSRDQTFYGWAKIQALPARKNGRTVQATAVKTNPYHADIIFPEKIEKDERITHAKELASHSEWASRFNANQHEPRL